MGLGSGPLPGRKGPEGKTPALGGAVPVIGHSPANPAGQPGRALFVAPVVMACDSDPAHVTGGRAGQAGASHVPGNMTRAQTTAQEGRTAPGAVWAGSVADVP